MFSKLSLIIVFASVAVLSVSLACGLSSPYPPEVSKAIEDAGDNGPELERVLNHYATEGDSLKYQAALYLIGNMEGHCFVDYYFIDTSGAEVPFEVTDYADFDELLVAADSIESQRGELDYERRDKVLDAETITADYLIEQIDYAFRAWRERPWARNLSFDQFLQYVLPYRGSNEPLEPWREFFWDKFDHIAAEMADSTDPIEAAALINDDIKTWFGFDPRYYYHPTDQSLSQMRESGLGRCEDMTNLTIYAMRANGLGVTSDYTPHWANTGNNHAWNAIVGSDGKVTPFMGAEANPGQYNLANKLAKVYRKTFGKQTDNLIFQDRLQEKVPGWLAGKSYADVTADYVEVTDITVTLDEPVPDSTDIAYLCVFNSGEWRPIQWGRIQPDRTVTFSDMGMDIAYLPALYLNEEVVPAAPPFIAVDAETILTLLPNPEQPRSLSLTSTTRRKQVVSTDGIAKTFLTKGMVYNLSYWDNGWQEAGSATAGERPLEFNDVPSGCLYWLVAEDTNREERIFTIDGDRQIWW